MTRCAVIGNGPSLTPEVLDALDVPAFAVNRIWRIFPFTDWRPDYYVRGEVPSYDELEVKDDLLHMADVGCAMYIQKGLEGLLPKRFHPLTRFEFFKTCDGSRHDWHMPEICGYGTVVHIAMQIAESLGYDEILLVGCDMTDKHFYKDEPFTNGKLAKDAHEIAQRCAKAKLIYA